MAKPPLPPPHPQILGAQRFFARILACDLECPHCGRVYLLRLGALKESYHDPRTARFTCRDCGRVYVLGLLAWPAGRGAGSNVPPADQVPGPRQLGQMRAEGYGWWMPDEYRPKGRPDPTNLTGEETRPEPEDPIDLELIDGAVEWRSEEVQQQQAAEKRKRIYLEKPTEEE